MTSEVPDRSANEIEEEKRRIKEEKRERAIQKLATSASSGKCKTLHEKVAYILSTDYASRNNDITLQWLFWRTFESEILGNELIDDEKSKLLTRLTSLVRARAKIQNEYNLFKADEKIRRYRGQRDEDFRTEAIEAKEKYPFCSVYIDESGKDDDFLIVGSLWMLNMQRNLAALGEMIEWKRVNGISYEFHFSEIGKGRLDGYKSFFTKFLSVNAAVSFKALILRRAGQSDIQRSLEDITYHLLYNGVIHEDRTGRAGLPRNISIYFDRESDKQDALKIENIKSRLRIENFGPGKILRIDQCAAVDSKQNDFIQIADLFTGSINRIVNHQDTPGNAKEEFAAYLLNHFRWNGMRGNEVGFAIDQAQIFEIHLRGEI
jgi:hypothetical protein